MQSLALFTGFVFAGQLIMFQENQNKKTTGIVILEGKPWKDCLVYLPAKGKEKQETKREFWSIKEGKFLKPHFVIQVNQPLRITWPKKETIILQHFSEDIPPGRLLPPKSSTFLDLKFGEPTDCIVFQCSVSPKLKGYLTVVPTKNFAFTEKNGVFVIPLHIATKTKLKVKMFSPTIGKFERMVEFEPEKQSEIRITKPAMEVDPK